MNQALRLGQLIAMVIWVGGLIFFAFVLAPTAFSVLPTVSLAGSIVGAALRELHVLGLICGALFLAVTGVMFSQAPMKVRGRYEMEFLLAGVMVLATAYLQWNVLPAMEVDRGRANGDISSVSVDHPARVHFDRLHKRSERVEGFVLLCGLGVVFLMSRELGGTENKAA
ncbi:DUF4149 domain-containing protein [Granulicella tundricola]|uniref:TMEM205-like domain-containing protein n=1 Tax=Granulicella tundricola (strain ATCC BAA-1859 / DSM 23138 / MP5ACTX9) TaxID=1198114 RepID=E8WXQ1_GRATM|nr:DUF4149 domain-containing protein [Granulicella tundricola]ADW68667.1 hypothetical protein AciX9_1614 [Granulicella tundricola MP5ACTX9]